MMAAEISQNQKSVVMKYLNHSVIAVALFGLMMVITQVDALTFDGNTTIDSTVRIININDLTDTAPYIIANRTTDYHYSFIERDGKNAENVRAQVQIQGARYNLSYSPFTKTYYFTATFLSNESGDYTFNVTGSKPFNYVRNTSFPYHVRDFVQVDINIYTTINQTVRYDNKDAYLLVIPRNLSDSFKRLGELAEPFEFMGDFFDNKIDDIAHFDDKKLIRGTQFGWHKRINTDGSTSFALPKDIAFSVYLIHADEIVWTNSYFSNFLYDTIRINKYLFSGAVDEDSTYDIYVSKFELHPAVTITKWVLWGVALLLIVIIPLVIGIKQGQPQVAFAVFGSLAILIPLITLVINYIIGWVFT